MRRPLIVLLSLLAVAVGGGATHASSSAAQPVIICPLVRGVLIPCCGPPVATPSQPTDVQLISCCPGPALCVNKLTIGSSPNPSKSNGSVAISGKLLAAAGTQVTLWQRLSGHSKFTQMTQTSTDASGAYSITRGAGRVQTNREWYATAGAFRSTTISQRVEAVVKLAGRVSGRSATLTGSVSPTHARQRVLVERKSGATWTVIARPRLNRRSRFGVKVKLAPNRTTTLRAILSADSRNILSTSASLELLGAP